jgi:hypothetical protein
LSTTRLYYRIWDHSNPVKYNLKKL